MPIELTNALPVEGKDAIQLNEIELGLIVLLLPVRAAARCDWGIEVGHIMEAGI